MLTFERDNDEWVQVFRDGQHIGVLLHQGDKWIYSISLSKSLMVGRGWSDCDVTSDTLEQAKASVREHAESLSPTNLWNISLTWANGQTTSMQMQGSTVDECTEALDRWTTRDDVRAGRRPLFGVAARAGGDEPEMIIHYTADGCMRSVSPDEMDAAVIRIAGQRLEVAT